MGDIRIPGSDDLRSLVDLIDSVDRLRLLITGSPNTPGLFQKTERLSDEIVEVLGLINATFTRLQSAASLESEIKELPMRLMKIANQQQFRESLRITLQEEHKKMVQANHEMALNFITENIKEQMCNAMIEAEQRVFGDSFVIKHKFYLENEVLMGQIDALKKRNIELEQRFYGCVADREKAVSELKNKQLRKLIPAMALSVVLGAIANNVYLPAVVHDFFIQRPTES